MLGLQNQNFIGTEHKPESQAIYLSYTLMSEGRKVL